MAGRALRSPRRAQLDVLRNASTRSQVYALLRRAIVSLDLLPGQALSENELAARYSVSRTPVREALIRLADEALVEVAPQLGTFVSRISVRDVVEIQFIRETLERASLPHAIKNITAADEASLRTLLVEQEEAGRKRDLHRWFATDESLHRTLLEIGGHPRVWPIVSSAKAHLDRVRMLSLPDPEILAELLTQHRAIVDFVTAKQRKKADEVLTQHLRIALDILEPLEEEYPDYFVLDEDEVEEAPAPRPAKLAATKSTPRRRR
ncbi:MAG: GntR family transcriptional regulator [Actinopolymorphaceae bacterium]|jgi:GntR family transcriptional regulator, rspAB operon transcriptional repressor